MAIKRKTRAEHLYQLERNLDEITGTEDHEPKLDAAFDQFLIDFAADTLDPDLVSNSDDSFIWPIAHLTLHLYYWDLVLVGEEVFTAKADHHLRMYNRLRSIVKYETPGGEDSVDTQKSSHIKLML